jgi:hypothetical protein
MLCLALTVVSASLRVYAEPVSVSLQALVTPSTTLVKDGRTVTFALHGFIEFHSLAELFPYIESQKQRWNLPGGLDLDLDLDEKQRRQLAAELLRRGIESRVISMEDERPLETLVTHTAEELQQALARVKEPVPPGYADAFLAVQEKWKHSLNCWSASPSISARALSNWYPIEEGIQLYGATYDSTEHFWQAVKYHPDVTVADLIDLLGVLQQKDWGPWMARLDADPKIYLPNAYAVEFLRHNLISNNLLSNNLMSNNMAPNNRTPNNGPPNNGRLPWFRAEMERQGLDPGDHPRALQQRGAASFRFSAFEEKVLWGDLADVFHLVYTFSLPDDPLRKALAERHFDAVYLGERRMGFISEEFRSLMLEIWRVKYLKMPRFREVIAAIPMEIQLSHFLNDGDSPDIPIPVYVGYLNQIRALARAP